MSTVLGLCGAGISSGIICTATHALELGREPYGLFVSHVSCILACGASGGKLLTRPPRTRQQVYRLDRERSISARIPEWRIGRLSAGGVCSGATWTTTSHTAQDVPVIAVGGYGDMMVGTHRNTVVADVMRLTLFRYAIWLPLLCGEGP